MSKAVYAWKLEAGHQIEVHGAITTVFTVVPITPPLPDAMYYVEVHIEPVETVTGLRERLTLPSHRIVMVLNDDDEVKL